MLAINLQRPIRLRKATARQALNVQRFVAQTIVPAGDLIGLALADEIVRYYGGFKSSFSLVTQTILSASIRLIRPTQTGLSASRIGFYYFCV
jgi:hypothetical protein